jgi:hypothetical protein
VNQQELAWLHHEAKAELMKIPGVVGVGYGRKERGGKVTDEIAFRVYVKEKKNLSDLKPEEVIPSFYKGIPTDVIKAREMELLAGVCDDHSTHDPLIGGILITTFKVDKEGFSGGGTLGFFAFILGRSGYNNIALVSNNHVLDAGIAGANVGDTVYQPSWTQDGGEWNFDPFTNPIADILKLPPKKNQSYIYPNEPENEFFVDCAAAQLHICVSPTCKTNCRQSFANSQRGLSINNSSAIADVGRLKHSDMGKDVVVYKSGAVTGVTKGIVTDPFTTGPDGQKNVFEILMTDQNCHGNVAFGEHGDSGAAILNDQSQLIGLLFARHPLRADLVYGCHIDPVLAALDLELVPVTAVNAPTFNPAYVADVNAAMAVMTEQRERMAMLRERLLQTEEGSRIDRLVETLGPEVMELVNHKRRVTVAWHRNKGPLFLNEAAANISDPGRKIPREIDGTGRDTLLRRMAEALMSYGSKGLREVVERYVDEAVSYVNQADSVHELVDLFSKAHKA